MKNILFIFTLVQFQWKWDEDPKMEFLFYGFLRAFRDPWRSPHKWPHRPNVTLVQTWRTCKDNKSSWPLVLLCKSATIICLTARPASRRRDLEITNYVARLMIILVYIYIYTHFCIITRSRPLFIDIGEEFMVTNIFTFFF